MLFDFKKKGITKEIFIAGIFIMLALAILLSQMRYTSRKEKAQITNVFDELDGGITDNTSPSIGEDFESRTQEALIEIDQSLEKIGNPTQLNASLTTDKFENFLANNSGKKVLLLFWSDWNKPSVETLNELKELPVDPQIAYAAIHQGKYSEDTPSVLQEMNFKYPIIEDPSGVISRKYQVFVIPTTVLLDRNHVKAFNIDGGMSKEQLYEAIISVQ